MARVKIKHLSSTVLNNIEEVLKIEDVELLEEISKKVNRKRIIDLTISSIGILISGCMMQVLPPDISGKLPNREFILVGTTAVSYSAAMAFAMEASWFTNRWERIENRILDLRKG